MKQRQRGAEEFSHWKAALEFNTDQRVLKNPNQLLIKARGLLTQLKLVVWAGHMSLILGLEKHLNINMDISPQFLAPCVTFQKISWTNHCKTTKTVYQMAATD